MTDSAVTELGARREATLRYRAAGWAALRAVASAVVVTIYYLLPWDRSSTGAAVTWLVIGLVVLIGMIAFQVRIIIRSPFPNLGGDAEMHKAPVTRQSSRRCTRTTVGYGGFTRSQPGRITACFIMGTGLMPPHSARPM